MTMRRLDRKRLFEVEKLGQTVDVGASPLMQKCIVSATQHREGQKLITDIVYDLGSSKQELISGGDECVTNDSLGAGSDAAYLCQLKEATFGAITSIESVCLEAFVGSAGALAGSGSLNLVRSASGAVALKGQNSPALISADIGDETGRHNITLFDNKATPADKYLYFGVGAQAGTDVARATATITVGTAEDEAFVLADNLIDEVSRISLTKADGSFEHKFFDLNGAQNYNGSQVAGIINAKTADTTAKIADGIARAFNGGSHSDFNAAAVGSSPNSHVVTIQQSATGENGNRSNFFADAPGKTAPITVTDFTGGTTKGDALPVTAGKFLIRVTGFVTPDDL